MKQMPKAARVMTPFPYSLESDAHLDEAEAMMAEHEIRHIPVTRDGAVVGVVGQPLVWEARAARRGDVTVGELLPDDPFIVEWNTPLDAVAGTMAARKLGAAVVTRQGRLAGIVTTTDVCAYLAERLQLEFGETSARDGDGDDVAE